MIILSRPQKELWVEGQDLQGPTVPPGPGVGSGSGVSIDQQKCGQEGTSTFRRSFHRWLVLSPEETSSI